MTNDKNFIVITTIFNPTDSVLKIAQRENTHLIVVGDKKTPKDWQIENSKAQITFLSSDDKKGYNIEKVLPYNHYCRKMLGYIYAKNQGAQFIYETDDDNYPKENWHVPNFEDEILVVQKNEVKFSNVYRYYSDEHIWPRGFPLELITNEKTQPNNTTKEKVKIGVFQGLVDNEPDFDAIYRLTVNKPVYFNDKEPIALSEGLYCPYNSQNTFTVKELFPLLYLPCTVTFRFTDILRGLIAQPIMNLYDYKLAFSTSTAIQERNVHDFMKDFDSEIPVYQNVAKVIELTENAIKKEDSLSDNLHNVYAKLLENDIVKKEEIEILEAWLNDIC